MIFCLLLNIFIGVHKHQPVVLLERLKNVDAVENIMAHPDILPIDEVKTNHTVPMKSRAQVQVPVSGRNPLLKRSMYIRSGGKKNKKRNTGRLKVKQRRNPIRKAAFKASLLWKYTSPVDTEFSIDDDKPLTFYTRTTDLNGPWQSPIILGSKNNNSGISLSFFLCN